MVLEANALAHNRYLTNIPFSFFYCLTMPLKVSEISTVNIIEVLNLKPKLHLGLNLKPDFDTFEPKEEEEEEERQPTCGYKYYITKRFPHSLIYTLQLSHGEGAIRLNVLTRNQDVRREKQFGPGPSPR